MDLALTIEPDADNLVIGDLHMVGNQLVLTTDLDDPEEQECAQDLWIRLQHFLGEWYLNRKEGIPYFRVLFRKGFLRASVDSMFRRALLSSPHVDEVLALGLELDRSARALAVEFSILRVDGTVQDFRPFVIALENP